MDRQCCLTCKNFDCTIDACGTNGMFIGFMSRTVPDVYLCEDYEERVEKE